MRILLTKIPTLAFIFTLFVFSQHAHSHCQIPCGIYDDHARYISMLEDASTVEKATDQIITLSNDIDLSIKLDKDKSLAMDQDNLSIQSILENIKLSSVGTVIEKCLLAREVIENIGDPLEAEYARWNQGVCNQFDVNLERQKIDNQLIAKYGSVSVYGD